MSAFTQRVPLQFSDGPLVWVDCEMTGLDPEKHKIIGIQTLFFVSITRKSNW